MNNLFKLIISNSRLYQEVELSDMNKVVKIGTTSECEVRLHRSDFFEDFVLSVEWSKSGWSLYCCDSIYIHHNAKRIMAKTLSHGDELPVCYRNYEQSFLTLYYVCDFEREFKRYDTFVDLSSIKNFQIGSSPECQMQFRGDNTPNERINVSIKGSKLILHVIHSEYGVLKNGFRASENIVIEDTDFFSCAQYSFYFRDMNLYLSNAKEMKITGFTLHHISHSSSNLVYPKFNKSTRSKLFLPMENIEILDPPDKPQQQKHNLLMSILPSVAMLLVLGLMSAFMGSSMGSMLIFSGCSMAIGIFSTVYQNISGKKEFKRNSEKRIADYKNYIQNKEKEIRDARDNELKILCSTYPESSYYLSLIDSFSSELFDRSKEDSDFLSVRIGTGTILANRPVSYIKKERISVEDELLLIPKELVDKYRYIESAPIVVDLKKSHNIAVIGNKNEIYGMFKNILLDISCRQFFRDISVFAVLGDSDIEKFSWIRFWPHMQNKSTGLRNIVCDSASRIQQFEYLYKEMSFREATSRKDEEFQPLVIMVYDGMGLYSHPLSRYISTAWKYNVFFIFFGEHKENLPSNCGKLIYLKGNGCGLLEDSNNQLCNLNFTYTTCSDFDMERVATKLAPVYCEEISLEGTLTKNITLFSLLGIWSADDLDLSRRWKESDICKTMAAPLGVCAKNETVQLDLHENFHGPHGLVAGTTGSGKSEILQSYILSMATLYHPYEVGFVIIDFKGGGMVNQFKQLPHLIGAITDIDGKEIDRSLLSIHAELDKRKMLFAEAEVNNISAYIRKYKKGEVKQPLPHLILIVDEFAELKADQPDFMKELISAARIGRSLGVHLILATQKPSGVIDGQIWSNSKFKLCLKVQSKEDSNEVLKSPLAAEIREPGRAYLQVGNNEVFELFQSAYSGASIESEEVGMIHPFKLYSVETSGRKTLLFEQKNQKGKEETVTQLKAIVSKVNQYCEAESIVALPPISLPPLTKYTIYDEDKPAFVKTQSIIVPIGVFDDPSRQRQDCCYLDLTTANTFILGSPQYGKTNLLQLILHAVADNYSPDEIQFYILDFSSMIMKNMEMMKHVGGVVLTSEDEKMKNFMKMMLGELNTRKQLLANRGLTSFASYKEAGYEDLPQIVIILDNYVPLKELYAAYEDAFLTLCRDGLTLGVSLIVTNSHTNGVGYKIMSNFAQKVCLYCNDSGEYSNIFERCRMQPSNIPGRGLIQIDKQIYEFQSYLSFDGEKEIDRVKQMRNFAEMINQKYPGRRAKRIPEVPMLLTEHYMNEQYGLGGGTGYDISVGIDYEQVQPVMLSLLSEGVIAVSGRKKSGKTNFLNLIMNYLNRNMFNFSSQLYLIDDYTRQLKEYKLLGITEKYTIDSSEILTVVDDIHAELTERFELMCDDGMEALEDKPLIMLVVANRDAISALSKSASSMKKYKEIVGKFTALKVCIIYADLDNSAIGFSGPEVLKMLKDNRNLYFFDDLKNLKLYDANNQALRTYKKEISIGDCYHITNDETVKLKTVRING